MLWIIAILLFAIAMGNEMSRRVLFALVGWALLLAAIGLVATIVIGLLLLVIAFAVSGSPFGPPLAAIYGFGALGTGLYYSSEMGFSSLSNLLFILCATLFWPFVWLIVIVAKARNSGVRQPKS